jgi:hypothetical protein
MLAVYQAIARGTADEPMHAPLPEGPLSPEALGNYLRLTDSVAEASTAAQIREAIGNATGMEKRQVAACLESAGLEENAANYYIGSLRTKKRVYKKDHLYAALVQTHHWLTDDDTMSDAA